MIYSSTTIRFFPIFSGYWLVGLILTIAIVAVLFCPITTRISPGKRRILLLLRLASLLLIALAMLRPTAIHSVPQKLPAMIGILIDRSKSMSVIDAPASGSRFEQLKKTLQNVTPHLERLENEYELQTCLFDKETVKTDCRRGVIEIPDEATGEQTAIGGALMQMARRGTSRRLTAILLLSDGTQRAAVPHIPIQDATLRLRDMGTPVYCVPFGSQEAGNARQDAAITDLVCNDQLFLGNELLITGQVRTIGLANQAVPVVLLCENDQGEMTAVSQTTFHPSDNEESFYQWQFNWTPTSLGEKKVQVLVPPVPNEFITGNNELSTYVRVVEGGLKVLYLEGTRRFEQKYLRLALDSCADMQVDYWRPAAPPATGTTETQRIAQNTMNRESFEKSLDDYSTFIIGDIDVTAFKENELKKIASNVAQGVGLILLAGQRTGAGGGFAQSPLSDLFPIVLNPKNRIPLASSLAEVDTMTLGNKLLVPGPMTFEPNPELNHSISQLSLDRQKNKESWQALPAFDSLYHVEQLKPGAIVPIFGKKKGSDISYPFLVTQNYGQGRVALLTGDQTWRWWMNGFESQQKRFYRQLLLWIAQQDEVPKGELVIELDNSRFVSGTPVSFRIIYRPDENEQADYKIRVNVLTPAGVSDLSLNEENGVASGVIPVETPGDYRIEAQIVQKQTGQEVKKTQKRFWVYSQHLELDNPAPSPQTLSNISFVTGGRVVPAQELDTLLDELLVKREQIVEFRKRRKTIYDSWAVLILFTTLMSLEWFLRKRWGIV